MPGEATDTGAGLALDAISGRATVTARSTYLRLFEAATAPTDSTPGTEIVDGGYSRQQVTWSVPTGDPRETQNTNTVTFGPFVGDPPSIGHSGLTDAASGAGAHLWRWQMEDQAGNPVTKDPAAGETLSFAPGTIKMRLD